MDEELNDAFDGESEFDNENENNNKNSISADLIRGHINTIILRTLYEKDKYGYEIIDEIEQKSHGQYSLKQPTLYSALKRLESQGYITAYWKTDEVSLGGRRKYYKLTQSGREVTEKNQSEWEYSRTVIDNLISNREFDFTQPAPTPLDFKILKQTTSRVPLVKDEKVDSVIEPKESAKIIESTPNINENKVLNTQKPNIENNPITKDDVTEHKENQPPTMTDEEKRIAHEKYLNLTQKQPKSNNNEQSNYYEQQNYNNNYLSSLDKLFSRTINQPPHSAEQNFNNQPNSKKTGRDNVVHNNSSEYDDLKIHAERDGLKISESKFVISSHKKCYNMGWALLKSSAFVVTPILAIVSILCFSLRVLLSITFAYPIVILSLCLVQLLVCSVIYLFIKNKLYRKPTSLTYITPSFVLSGVLIATIFLVAFLLKINFNLIKDIAIKIIFPSITTLSIPAFTVSFYAFSK